jgi:hypothetical protein
MENALYDELNRRQSVIDAQTAVIAERDKLIRTMMQDHLAQKAEITRLRQVLKVVALAVHKHGGIRIV